jgi:hypothetical protein
VTWTGTISTTTHAFLMPNYELRMVKAKLKEEAGRCGGFDSAYSTLLWVRHVIGQTCLGIPKEITRRRITPPWARDIVTRGARVLKVRREGSGQWDTVATVMDVGKEIWQSGTTLPLSGASGLNAV